MIPVGSGGQITVEEAAEKLAVSPDEIRRLAKSAFKTVTVVMFDGAQIEELTMLLRERGAEPPVADHQTQRKKLMLKHAQTRSKRNTTTIGGDVIVIEGRKVRPSSKRAKLRASKAANSKLVVPVAKVAKVAMSGIPAVQPRVVSGGTSREVLGGGKLAAPARPPPYVELYRRQKTTDPPLTEQAVPPTEQAVPPTEQAVPPTEQAVPPTVPPAPPAAPAPSPNRTAGERVSSAGLGSETRRRRNRSGTLRVDRANVETRRKSALRRRSAKDEMRKQEFQKPEGVPARVIDLPNQIPVTDLARQLAIKTDLVVAKLEDIDIKCDENSIIDQETAILLVEEFGHRPKAASEQEPEMITLARPVEGEVFKDRPPVVTMMGHVDHGKTSLLDRIRNTEVATGEAGGITQSIGASLVSAKQGPIVFIDTPGHEVFTQMRARGAQVTDIVVLVVAADDGVQPQTIEAINHARAAKVPIVVAINKIDKPEAKPERVCQQLAEHGLQSEEWGGEVIMAQVSAESGEGIDKLLESILLTASIIELRVPFDVPGKGSVIEARMEKGLGVVVSVIIRSGKIRKGEIILCNTQHGRVRMLRDSSGCEMLEAGPAMPVLIQGLSSLPEVGCEFMIVASERTAREYAEKQRARARVQRLASEAPVTTLPIDDPEAWMEKTLAADLHKNLNLIVKGDVAGSVEALGAAVAKLGNDEASVRVLHKAVGGITENDVYLAEATGARIIGFKVRPNSNARKLIAERRLKANSHEIIYEAINEIKAALEDMLEPERAEKIVGTAEVRQLFNISKIGLIAGCAVTEGVVNAKLAARVVRDGVIVNTGEVACLRHFKDNVTEVEAGSECGIQLRRFADFKVGDLIESIEVTITARTL